MAVGKNISFFVNGFDLACALKSFSPTAEVETLDSTTLCATNYRTHAQGLRTGTLSAEGIWDADTTNADAIDDVMKSAFSNGTEMIVTASLETLAVGGVAILMNGSTQNYSVNPELGQLIMVSLSIQSTNAVNFGKWLFNASVDDTTTNGTSVDNGAASANGGIGHAHQQDVDTTDPTTVTFQHSILGSIWVDLGEIELDGAHDAGSLVIAPGTAIYRYTRAIVTTTGGEAVIQAAFARR